MSDKTIPERWQPVWKDWNDSLSSYAWKDTAQRAVMELGAAEAQVETLVKALEIIRDGANSWSVDATPVARAALRERDGAHSWSVDATDLARAALREVGR
jgi:hypothetical protein